MANLCPPPNNLTWATILLAVMLLSMKTVGTAASLCPLAGAEYYDKVQGTVVKVWTFSVKLS